MSFDATNLLPLTIRRPVLTINDKGAVKDDGFGTFPQPNYRTSASASPLSIECTELIQNNSAAV